MNKKLYISAEGQWEVAVTVCTALSGELNAEK